MLSARSCSRSISNNKENMCFHELVLLDALGTFREFFPNLRGKKNIFYCFSILVFFIPDRLHWKAPGTLLGLSYLKTISVVLKYILFSFFQWILANVKIQNDNIQFKIGLPSSRWGQGIPRYQEGFPTHWSAGWWEKVCPLTGGVIAWHPQTRFFLQ